MISILIVIALQSSSSELICGGTDSVKNCRAVDGSTYIERRIGERLIRKGTTPTGDSWTEYVSRNLDGWRLQGEDTRGGRWFQSCNAQSGTHGTDRNGRAFSRPADKRGCAY